MRLVNNRLLSFVHSYDIELSGTNFVLDASALETQITYTVDNSLSKPIISLTLTRGSGVLVSDLVSVSADKKTISLGDYKKEPTTSSDPTTSTSATGSATSSGGSTPSSQETTNPEINSSNRLNGLFSFSFLVSILTFGLYYSLGSSSGNGSRSKSGLIILSALVLFIGCGIALNLDDVALKVEIKAPASFVFDSLTINLGKGSSSVSSLRSQVLVINGCNQKSHSFSMSNVYASNLNVCTQTDVSITNLEVPSSSKLNITSSAAVTLGFLNQYAGSVDFISKSPSISGDCQTSTSGQQTTGTCNGGGSSNLIVSGSAITVDLVATCPTTSTWRPTPASGTAPTSPAISTSYPARTFVWNQPTDWKIVGHYGFEGTTLSTVTTGTSNGVSIANSLKFTIGYADWGPTHYSLALRKGFPSLKTGVAYTFDFSFLLGEVAGSYNTISNMTLYLIDRVDLSGTSQYFETPTQYKYKYSLTSSYTSTNAWVTKSIPLTVTQPIGDVTMILQMNRTGQTGNVVRNYYFKDFRVTIPASTVPTPTLITKESQYITIPKPDSTVVDVQTPSTCPYLATDLVHWHDPATWGGTVPSPSSVITLPANKKVLISPCSISTDIYQKIIIPQGSSLIFADSDITMNIKDILVQGQLIIGTKTCRYNANIELVFYGAKTTSDTIAQYFGSKGIAGTATSFISIQGKQYHNTWTRLAATVWPGDKIIYLLDAVNWEVGQQVVITTSIMEDELSNQNEVMTIAAIQGKTVEFTTPFNFYHYGGKEYQSEVGLLSRKIVIRGDPTSSDADSFGGHILTMGEGQFSGIRLHKMGQKNMKARYPVHFHLANTLLNSYITDCAVHQSYYRCYTIHGTNNLLLSRNVGFDINGHCYYLEDGVEENNTISYNLGAYVHTIGPAATGYDQSGQMFYENPLLTQPADSSAGCFYFTNAYNKIIGNSASGGWAGFSFPNLAKPIGNFQTSTVVPQSRSTLVFEGNTAHSSGYQWEFGGSLYVGGNLYVNTSDSGRLAYSSGRNSRETVDSANNNVWMRFNNTKMYLSNRGIDMWGERVEVVNLESHDSNRPATLFGEAWFDQGYVNGQSGNILSNSQKYDRQGFQFYDTYVKTILSNIKFANFIAKTSPASDEEDNRVIISMTHSDVFKPQGMSVTKNITFENVAAAQKIGHNVVDTGSSRYFNYIDSDGSFSGRGVPTLIGSHVNWWNFDSSCTYDSTWKTWVCNKGTKEIVNIEVLINNLIPSPNSNNNKIGNTTLFGSSITDRRSCVVTQNEGITGVSNMGWYMFLTGGSPTFQVINLKQIPYNQYIFLAIPYPANTQFTIYSYYKWNTSYNIKFTLAASAAAVRSGNGRTYYFDGSFLYVKLVDHTLNPTGESFARGGAQVFNYNWGYSYNITATCAGASGGFCPVTADNLPSSSL
ncbi:hypothetical protein CYY_000508 [Polysphondylium violaceum]|uniref:G8 domain-containing protein n=1 Tax=Polysphondylium violaceum TaxID=133409 RepID=A0A8J4Q1G8_9MYCE|nr:hypothetical protein CYY_000508 [Polysphondylium violaceum]